MSAPDRPLGLTAVEFVDRLPEEYLATFQRVARERYPHADDPVVALTNETMRLMINQDKIHDMRDTLETSKGMQEQLLYLLTRETDYTRSELIERCQSGLARFNLNSGDCSIRPRAQEIKDSLDPELKTKFKYQAYHRFEKSDEAVVKHTKEAISLMFAEKGIPEIVREKNEQRRMVKGLAEIAEEELDIEIGDLEGWFEFL